MAKSDTSFKPGASGNPAGRPKGSGKQHVKDVCWDALSRVVWLVFELPEPEMVKWVKENVGGLTRAEKVLLDKTKDIRTIEALLDRIVGKAAQMIVEKDISGKIEFVTHSEDDLNG